MPQFQHQLLQDKWLLKKNELISHCDNKCSTCNNYSILKDVSIGYLLKTDNGSYKIFETGSRFLKMRVKATDYYTRSKNLNRSTINVFFPNDISILLEDNKFYIVYFRSENNNPDMFLAIVEADDFVDTILWDTEYEDSKSNPFRKRAFLIKSQFLFIKGLFIHFSTHYSGLAPWDYPKSSCKCICWTCLLKLVSNKKIPSFDGNRKSITQLTPCPRCLGQGVFPEHLNVNMGLCFECNGHQYID